MLFAPTDLDIDITPQAVRRALSKQEYTLAVNIALHLGERDVLKGAADAVPIGDIELVVRSLDPRVLRQLLKFIAEEIVSFLVPQCLLIAAVITWCHAPTSPIPTTVHTPISFLCPSVSLPYLPFSHRTWYVICFLSMSCHAVPCHVVPCHAMPCHAMQCRVMPCRPPRGTPSSTCSGAGRWCTRMLRRCRTR